MKFYIVLVEQHSDGPNYDISDSRVFNNSYSANAYYTQMTLERNDWVTLYEAHFENGMLTQDRELHKSRCGHLVL